MQFAELNRRNLWRQLIVMAILFGFVFQLGNSPCGCIEHNAWTQLICDDHHDEAEAEHVQAASPDLNAWRTMSCHSQHEPCHGAPPVTYIATGERFALLGQLEQSFIPDRLEVAIQHPWSLDPQPPVACSRLFDFRDGCRSHVLLI